MSNNSNIVLNTMRELYVASAAEVADTADISVSSARKWLNQLVDMGHLTVTQGLDYNSDSGRMVTINRYALKEV